MLQQQVAGIMWEQLELRQGREQTAARAGSEVGIGTGRGASNWSRMIKVGSCASGKNRGKGRDADMHGHAAQALLTTITKGNCNHC